MNTAWSRPTKYIAGVAIAALALFIIYLARSVIPLLIVAALIAVIVRPIVTWLHKPGGFPRGLAVVVVYLALIFIIPVLVSLAVPAIIEAFRYVISLDYQAILQDVVTWLRSSLAGLRDMRIPLPALDNYIDQMASSLLTEIADVQPTAAPITAPPVDDILRSLGSALTVTFDAATGILGAVFSRVTLMIFLILASVYMSLGAHTYRDSFLRAMPPAYQPEIAVLMARLGRSWNAFFRGQLSLMLVIGLVSWLGLTILGVPGAPYLGIIAGMLEIIPNLGPVIATIPAVIVALLQGSTWIPVSNLGMALIVVLFYILVQQLENNLIVPRLLGGAVDLPPLVVMSGVLVGATSFGILGALLATPVIASLREILRYVYQKIQGEPAYTPEEMVLAPEALPAGELIAMLRQRFYAYFRRPARAVKGQPVGARVYPDPHLEVPKRAEPSTVSVAGVRVHFYQAGEGGPAVLLLHGGGVDSARLSWGLLLPELAQNFRVYAPDLPGYGESDRPDDFDYTVEGLVRFTGQFMDAVGLQKAHVVGISMGGAAAIGFALEHPRRVDKLVLVDSYGLQRKAPMQRLGYLSLRTPGMYALTAAMMRSRPALRAALGGLLKRPGALTEELVDLALVESMRPGAAKAWNTFQRSEVLWDGTRTVFVDRLGEIQSPTLIVHGSADTLVPPECATEAQRRIPNARLAWIDGAGHWPQRDDPETFNRVVREFLEEE